MAIKCHYSPLQDILKFTQIGIFGLKIKHLATLSATTWTTMTLSLEQAVKFATTWQSHWP
jgi:hypothetical protein